MITFPKILLALRATLCKINHQQQELSERHKVLDWRPAATGRMIMTRAIHAIAYEIKREWKKPYFGAIPYLNAMCYLSNITDAYGADSGKSAVLYFLSNAATWQGEKAKAIKIELKYLIEDAEDNYPPKESWKFQARERYGDDP